MYAQKPANSRLESIVESDRKYFRYMDEIIHDINIPNYVIYNNKYFQKIVDINRKFKRKIRFSDEEKEVLEEKYAQYELIRKADKVLRDNVEMGEYFANIYPALLGLQRETKGHAKTPIRKLASHIFNFVQYDSKAPSQYVISKMHRNFRTEVPYITEALFDKIASDLKIIAPVNQTAKEWISKTNKIKEIYTTEYNKQSNLQ